jgi:hypothetical protein
MPDLPATSPTVTGTDHWTTIIGLLGLTIVAGLLAGAMVLGAREALRKHLSATRRIADVRSRVNMITARRRVRSSRPDIRISIPVQRVRVSGRAGALMPGRRQDAPDAAASRDRSTVT